jgi:hypothetical protein
VKIHNEKIKWNFLEIKTCFQGEISVHKINFIFSEIKTWFQGEISECKNKIKYSKN